MYIYFYVLAVFSMLYLGSRLWVLKGERDLEEFSVTVGERCLNFFSLTVWGLGSPSCLLAVTGSQIHRQDVSTCLCFVVICANRVQGDATLPRCWGRSGLPPPPPALRYVQRLFSVDSGSALGSDLRTSCVPDHRVRGRPSSV